MQSFASVRPKCSKRSRNVKSLRSKGEPSCTVRFFQRPRIRCTALVLFSLVRAKENVFCTRLKASKTWLLTSTPTSCSESQEKAWIHSFRYRQVRYWASQFDDSLFVAIRRYFPSCAMRPLHASELYTAMLTRRQFYEIFGDTNGDESCPHSFLNLLPIFTTNCIWAAW